MNKRILAVCLTLFILLGSITVTASEKACARLSQEYAFRGETVELKLDLTGCNGFANLGFEISYDSSVLTLLSADENPITGVLFNASEDISANPYNVNWDSTSNVCYNGNLAVFTFRIADDAKAGKYPVNLSYYKGRYGDYTDGTDVNYDEHYNPLDLSYVNGAVNVSYTPIVKPEAGADNTYNGNTYMVIEQHMPWNDARKLCEEAGGHLAAVTSAKENDFVYALCSNSNDTQYFLGATDTVNDGIWEWINQESFVYSNWSFGEPDSRNNGNAYLALSTQSGKWSSVTDACNIGFVCEWEGESSAKDNDYWVEFVSSKNIYAIGEDFEVDVWLYTGDSVIRIYDNDFLVSGFDSSKSGLCSVTVSYGEYSKVFDVEIVEKEIKPVVKHVVQAVATEGVTISPGGYCEVNDGAVMKFVIGAKTGYNIENVSVNGMPVKLSDGNLSITIEQNTVIEVSGRKKTYSIIQSTIGNGYIQLLSDVVEYGNNCTARIVADEGYVVSDVVIDGKSVGACNLYTFTDVKDNHTIEAFFEQVIQTRTVKASAGAGGKIYPAKSIINSGGSVKFILTPDYGYHISHVIVGDETLTPSSNEVTLYNITKDTSVMALFEKDLYSVSVIESDGAEISVVYNGQSSDKLYIPYMDTADIVIDVADGYKLNTLYVNNMPVKPNKIDGRLVYNTIISKDTIVTARCGITATSEFNQEVAKAGLAAAINSNNAVSKKEEFTILANKYAKLSEEEKLVCTSSYATVLAALDRANAYIALNESGIVEWLLNIPLAPEELNSDNYSAWKDDIENIYVKYEKLTPLSKSLIDYEYVTKLVKLRTRAEELYRESMNIVSYFYELVNAVPDEGDINSDNLSSAYSKLILAEDTYYNMSEANKELVSEEMYNKLFEKHGRISTQIHKLYVTPFTSKVLRCSPVNASDSFADAEEKRVIIYDLMNEYHSLPAFVQQQVTASTVQKLNSLYESASIKVSATVNNLPVDMNGDFDENVDLVLTEPEVDDNIAVSTGKSVYQAIDVKMYSNDEEIQPTSKIRIKMEISKELATADVSVVYISDDGAVYDVQGEVIEESGKYYIVFFIDHFSSFAVLYNEDEAPETAISFDREYVEVGDYVTADVTGAVNVSNCNLWLIGYSADNSVTFSVMTSDSTVTGVVADDTKTIKAMLWDKNMAPIVNDECISVMQ